MKTVLEIHKSLINKEKSVKQIVEEYKSNILKSEKRFNDKVSSENNINAILRFFSDELINTQIAYAEKLLEEGKATKLTGIPIIIKDNILVKGETISAGSKMLNNYTATYNASVIELLKKAGAILLAISNMDEFAMGSSGETSFYGATKNPINTSLVSGGSSSGSAASVAANYAPLALGSDTGGSIRLPASFCNLVGFKPSYGMVSRDGLIAMSSSFDQIGPIAKSVEEVEEVFEIISQYDSKDATSIKKEIRENKSKVDSNSQKIGIPQILKDEKVIKDIDPIILKNFNDLVSKLVKEGYSIEEIDIPNLDKALAIYYIISPAEISSNMGRYDGVRFGYSANTGDTIQNFIETRTEGLGQEVRRRILLGTYILSTGHFDAHYNKAILAREVLREEFQRIFEKVEVIMTPTSPMLPWKLGEITNPLSMYLVDFFTVPANIVGSPAISLPLTKRENLKENELPIGVHLTANFLEDKKLLKIAKDIEKIILN